MTEPTRIRAQITGDKANVRILMTHEMETGQRKDASGNLVPAWYIQDVTVRHNNKIVMTAQWGSAISKNPYLQFTLKGAKVGDKLSLNWKDTQGASRTDEATLA
jgi:sulfur-oxidizing protein SoxZ